MRPSDGYISDMRNSSNSNRDLETALAGSDLSDTDLVADLSDHVISEDVRLDDMSSEFSGWVGQHPAGCDRGSDLFHASGGDQMVLFDPKRVTVISDTDLSGVTL